jgi:hypothetical protein
VRLSVPVIYLDIRDRISKTSPIFIPLVLGWDGTGQLLWSVDASFAIHKDMRSHTSAVLSLGQGALMPMSIKQKINTKSSTEAELVGVDDAMNFVEWIQLFVEQQIKSINEDSVLKKIGCVLRPLRYSRSYLDIKLMSKVIMSYSIVLGLFPLQLLFSGVCDIIHQLVDL